MRLMFMICVLALPVMGQHLTPFCDVCLCTSLSNEPPTINCISEDIQDIFSPKFWFDETNTLYPIKSLIVKYNELNVLGTKFPYSNLRKLDLSRNSIRIINDGIFSELQEMRTLILSHNEIDYLSPHIFKGSYEKSLYFPLRSLRKLDLEYNKLHTLNADVFEHIDELEDLNLSNNPFKVIDYQTVQAITSLVFLKTLRLSYAQLKTLPEYFLHAPKYLKTLDLTGNFFESIPSAVQHSEVTTLFLNKNHFHTLNANEHFPKKLRRLYLNQLPFLTAIKKGAFGETPKLSVLHMNDNPLLSVVEKNALSDLPLVTLSMSNNNLSYVDKDLFLNLSDLEELKLSGNPWNCDCSIRWIFNKSFSNNFLSRLKCSNPPDLEGITFYELHRNESKLSCKQTTRKVRRYIIILMILGVLLSTVLLITLFYVRRKKRLISGPKFQIISSVR